MNSNKIFGLDDWKLDKEVPDAKRTVSVLVNLNSIEESKVLKEPVDVRKKKIAEHYRKQLKSLLDSGLIGDYQLFGTRQRPFGIIARIKLADLNRLAKLSSTKYIFIRKISSARKIKSKPVSEFYCVKMIVAIEAEGVKNGLQDYEERFVLVKAKSHEDAYRKMEKAAKNYGKPSLHTNGYMLRWRVESYEDCYRVGEISASDLDNPEGVEVYSILKKRRLTKDRFWDGNLKNK